MSVNECHCAACGAPVPRTSAHRISDCCQAPRCNGAGLARYAPPDVALFWVRDRQFLACCDAMALQRMAGHGTPRRVADW